MEPPLPRRRAPPRRTPASRPPMPAGGLRVAAGPPRPGTLRLGVTRRPVSWLWDGTAHEPPPHGCGVAGHDRDRLRRLEPIRACAVGKRVVRALPRSRRKEAGAAL